MNNEKHITIAVPALNSAATIERTLQSLLAQSGCRVSIVVADSGSTDRTLEICRDMGVTSLYVPPGNMYRAINAVLRDSKTDWIGYLNSDDWVYSTTFSRLISHAEHSGADVVYGNCDYVDFEGRLLYSFSSTSPRALPALFRYGIFGFAQQAAIFKSSLYKQLNGFDEKYLLGADADFYARASLAGARFQKLPGEAVAAFRLHEMQLTNMRMSEFKKEQRAIQQSYGEPRFPIDMLEVAGWRIQNIPNYIVRVVRKFWLRS